MMFEIINEVIKYDERFNLNGLGMLIKELTLVKSHKAKVI